MRIFRRFTSEAAKTLKGGGVGVVPTDTLYGMSASVFYRDGIERIYRLRKRNRKKPLIVLIASFTDLKRFGIRLKPEIHKLLTDLWPGKVSAVLPCLNKRFDYLHRGTGTLAFRLPKYPKLRAFLKKTGPIVSTSVNPEGLPPAKTIAQAVKYFGDKVDFYIDAGHLDSPSSTVVSLLKWKPEVLRQGAARIGG